MIFEMENLKKRVRRIDLERGIKPMPDTVSLPWRVVKALNRKQCAACLQECSADREPVWECLISAMNTLRRMRRDYLFDSNYQLNRLLVQFADETGLIERTWGGAA